MNYMSEKPSVKPRIIIHGGAGNITRQNLTSEAYSAYRSALLAIVKDANAFLNEPGASALDVATHAVTLLENNPLFNAGRGAVFTRSGTNELEASVMVSKGYRKRGVGVMKLRTVRNPITLAREMLIRGERSDGGGAQGHCQIEGETCDRLAREWGLDVVDPSYFWTRKRWDEHRKGLGLPTDDQTYQRHKHEIDRHSDQSKVEGDSLSGGLVPLDIDSDGTWNGRDYLPQGTVGCVVLDSTGTICVATSTGGLTNKLPGRIGDTPTLGAGFWAEEWLEQSAAQSLNSPQIPAFATFTSLVSGCLPGFHDYMHVSEEEDSSRHGSHKHKLRAVAMSGTGNGDSFLRLNAVRTAAAMSRFLPAQTYSHQGATSLQTAVTAVAGPNGSLQNSAEDRWLKTGEGEGGIIGIELREGVGRVVFDFNCGGMFRTWIDEDGKARMMVFREAF